MEGELEEQTKSEIIAAQDQAQNTKYYVTMILKTADYSKCRMCHWFGVIVQYLTAECS